MQIKHRRFQVAVAKYDLQVPHKRPPVQGVRCKSMTQVVGSESVKAAALSGGSDGPLHVRLMAAPSDEFTATRVPAQCMRREHPGPALIAFRPRVFLREQARECDWDTACAIFCGNFARLSQLLL